MENVDCDNQPKTELIQHQVERLLTKQTLCFSVNFMSYRQYCQLKE